MEEIIAEKSFTLGNFLTAERQYKKLAESALTDEDKIYFSGEAERASALYKKAFAVSSGEVFFPVYNEKEKSAQLLKVKVENINNGDTSTNEITKIVKPVTDYLDLLLKKEVKTIFVFDWNVKNLNFKFFDLHGKEIDPKKIKGRSYELAVAIAMISFLIKKKVSPQNIFTGEVDSHGKIGRVEYIEQKYEVCKNERKGKFNFVIPSLNKNRKDGIRKVSMLSECFLSVFGNSLLKAMKNINEVEGIRAITLEIKKVLACDKQRHMTAIFTHPATLTDQETKLVMTQFISAIVGFLSSPQGMILDGLKQSPIYARVSSLLKENHISNFIAIRNYRKDDDTSGKSRATVYVVGIKGDHTRQVGDSFEYYLPKEKT